LNALEEGSQQIKFMVALFYILRGSS